MALTLFTYPNNPRAQKALIAAQYGGVQVDVPEFQFGVDNKTKEFLAVNPHGKVPALSTPDGGVFESTPIARYVAGVGSKPDQLLGESPYSSSLIDAWCTWCANEVELPASAIIYQIMGFIPYSKEGTDKAVEDLKAAMKSLDTHLGDCTWFVGERVSLADIVVGCTLIRCYTMLFDDKFRKPYRNVNRWFDTFVHQPEVAAVIGNIELCKKMQVPSPDAYKPPAAAAAAAPADKKKSKKKDEKNPLDLLPPSSFSLEEFKRLYSNNDIRSVVVPQFWETFDTEGYSIWFVEYKYSDDLKLGFMASNLVGGWFQRQGKVMHQHAFASVLVVGTEGENMGITGVWIFRGQDIPQEMLDNDDSEHYTWTKFDGSDGDKKRVEDYFAWDGESFATTPVIDGKNFK